MGILSTKLGLLRSTLWVLGSGNVPFPLRGCFAIDGESKTIGRLLLEQVKLFIGFSLSLTMSHSVYAGHFVRIPPYMAHRWHHHIWVIWPKFMQEGCIR
jgi:hypothetical protein